MQHRHYRIRMTLAALALGGMLPAFGASSAPTITGYAAAGQASVLITSAPPGASLLILGANFGTTPGTVAFAGTPAPILASWSPTQIMVTVPAAASYPFTGPVTVTASGQTAAGPAFTTTAPPAFRPGNLDPGFGTGGEVVTAVANGNAIALALALQPDGRIVAAGAATSSGYANFALTRYNIDGSLDVSFGTGGKVVTVYKSGYSVANAVALQPDGRIVAAGRILVKGRNQFGVARYNVNGTPDTTFGTGGTVQTGFDGDAELFAVAVQPDGRIVAAGALTDSTGYQQFALARYTATGSPDTSFGGGTVVTDLGGQTGAAAMALQRDGLILVAGGAGNQFALVRYGADGSLDTGFGSGGTASTDFNNGAGAKAMALQPDGRIVAAGLANNDNGQNQFGLARFNADGSLDSGFGTGGTALADFGDSFSIGGALAVQPDGRIVVAGGHTDAKRKNYFALMRYNGDGSPDTSFGTGGALLTGLNGVATAVAVQPDGQIVAAGDSGTKFALARYQGR